MSDFLMGFIVGVLTTTVGCLGLIILYFPREAEG